MQTEDLLKQETLNLHDLRDSIVGFRKKKTIVVIAKIFNKFGIKAFDHPWKELLRRTVQELDDLIIREKTVSLRYEDIFEKETILDERLKDTTKQDMKEMKARGTSRTQIIAHKKLFKEEKKNEKYADHIKELLTKLKEENIIQEQNIKPVLDEVNNPRSQTLDYQIREQEQQHFKDKDREEAVAAIQSRLRKKSQEFLDKIFQHLRDMQFSTQREDAILSELEKNIYVKEKILEHIRKDLWQQ